MMHHTQFSPRLLAALFLLGLLPASLPAQPVRVKPSGPLRLTDCAPNTYAPCFEASFDFVDGADKPVHPSLRAKPALLNDIELIDLSSDDNEKIHPFHAELRSVAGETAQKPRTVLILVDISGSMLHPLNNRKRIDYAREAISAYLDASRDGDRIAIAPFGSRNVVSTIRQAPFSETIQAAREELARMTTPIASNNTALYSAVDEGVRRLLAEKGRDAQRDYILIVLTDGKNEVSSWQGDDQGLLQDSALTQVGNDVKRAGIEVQGFGFGEATSVDMASLKQITTFCELAEDPERLRGLFAARAGGSGERLFLTFTSPLTDRGVHSGRTLSFKATILPMSGPKLETAPFHWHASSLGSAYQADCSAEEKQSALDQPNLSEANNSNLTPLIRPTVVALVLGGLIALLWLWIGPSLFPDRQTPVTPLNAPAYHPMIDTQAGDSAARGGYRPRPR